MLGKPDYDLRSAGGLHCASHQCRPHRWGRELEVVPTHTVDADSGVTKRVARSRFVRNRYGPGCSSRSTLPQRTIHFRIGISTSTTGASRMASTQLCRQLICGHRAQEHHPCAARLRCRRNGRACMPACRRRGIRQAGRHDSDQRRNAVRNTGRNQSSSHRHRLTHPWPTFEHEVGDDAVYAGQSAFAVFRNTTG
jgi:hypothetical protein